MSLFDDDIDEESLICWKHIVVSFSIARKWFVFLLLVIFTFELYNYKRFSAFQNEGPSEPCSVEKAVNASNEYFEYS